MRLGEVVETGGGGGEGLVGDEGEGERGCVGAAAGVVLGEGAEALDGFVPFLTERNGECGEGAGRGGRCRLREEEVEEGRVGLVEEMGVEEIGVVGWKEAGDGEEGVGDEEGWGIGFELIEAE